MVYNQLVHNKPPKNKSRSSACWIFLGDLTLRFCWEVTVLERNSTVGTSDFQVAHLWNLFEGNSGKIHGVFATNAFGICRFLWLFPSSHLGITNILIFGKFRNLYPVYPMFFHNIFQELPGSPLVVSCICFLYFPITSSPMISDDSDGTFSSTLVKSAGHWTLLMCVASSSEQRQRKNVTKSDSWRKGNEQLSLFCWGVLGIYIYNIIHTSHHIITLYHGPKI